MKRVLIKDDDGNIVAKTCTKCNRAVPIDNFHRRDNGGLSSHCPDCRNKRNRKLYRMNSEKVCARTRAYQKSKLGNVINILRGSSCKDCGEQDFRLLVFVHTGEKSFDISRGVAAKSWDAVRAEIDRCEVVCKNCCYKRRAIQRNNYKVATKLPRRAGKRFILKYLSDHPCVKCGESDVAVLEFHHRTDKVDAVARMVANNRPVAVIREEVAKCDVICANCHMLETMVEQGWGFRSDPVPGDSSPS